MENYIFGKCPLFIFSQNASDGDYLSVLLSNHLKPSESLMIQDRPLTIFDNYFVNEAIHRCVENFKFKQKQIDINAQLGLLIDEGFDTNKLYGLSLPLSLFASVKKVVDESNGFCLFIYDEFETTNENIIVNFKEIFDFISNNAARCFVLNSKLLVSNPVLIMKDLALLLSADLMKEGNVLPQTMLSNFLLNHSSIQCLPKGALHFLKQADSILANHKWFDGKDLCVIFYDVSHKQEYVLQKRIQEIAFSFLNSPFFLIAVEDENDIHYFKNFIEENGLDFLNIEFILGSNSLPKLLNNIIEQSNATCFLVDDLKMNYPIMQFLPEGDNFDDRIKFGKITDEEKSRTISISDLLIKDYPRHNLFFSKNIWQEISGFDDEIETQFVFWDFVIRVYDQVKIRATLMPSSIALDASHAVIPVFDELNNLGYKKVLLKHELILTNCLNEIVELASEEQQNAHIENKRLFEKIAQLQMIALHAKDELKSLQNLTAQLQQRIVYLEDNWYQKLRLKFNRIKKIFFKKKSPGSGNLKRILQFIRFAMSKAGFGIVRKIGANILKKLFLIFEKRPVEIIYKDLISSNGIFTYHDWIKKKLDKDAIQLDFDENIHQQKVLPKISIIMPVYNAPIKYLKEAIESVINQVYTNWELCIADDCSTHPKVKKLLHIYSVKDNRIKIHYRKVNGHISATSNDALAMVTGEYVLLMDHDDEISKNCLWEIVKAIHSNPKADILYSDEDKIDENHYHKDAHFKPDWAPDHLLSRNYMGHVTVLKKSIIDKIGGFRLGFEGSQDYDLMLRATELTNEIIHIPKVLYHWRIHQLSAAQSEDVKPYAYIAAKKALDEALKRRGLVGDVKYLSGLRGYKIDYEIRQPELISIIIPTKDQTALLKNTIDTIVELTGYKNYEIIVLNNNSTSKEFYLWADEYSKKYASILKIVEAHMPFNFSKLMNIGVSLAKGEHILLLNNDVEIIHSNWLEVMLSYSQQKRIGAVGVRLLYPDDTIQHAGVIIGLGGIAGHSFVGAYKDEAGYFNYIQSVNNYSAVTAACLMCRKEVFEKVGGMDEIFEVEYNDVDFCLKLIDAGYNNVYLPQVELYHYESATRGHPHQSKPSYERHLKEMKLFKDKWEKYIDHDPFYNPHLNLGVHDFSMNFSS